MLKPQTTEFAFIGGKRNRRTGVVGEVISKTSRYDFSYRRLESGWSRPRIAVKMWCCEMKQKLSISESWLEDRFCKWNKMKWVNGGWESTYKDDLTSLPVPYYQIIRFLVKIVITSDVFKKDPNILVCDLNPMTICVDPRATGYPKDRFCGFWMFFSCG